MSRVAGAKSEETSRRILHAALEVFRREGFANATMREIAREAGMAVGAAYYHFDSKDSLVMAFYERAQEEMQPLMAAALESPRDLRRRIEAVIEVKLRYFARDRALLRALTSHIDPADPLSPFSLETKAIRARDIEMFGKAIGGARQKTHPDLAGHMPGLLWLYQMGLILYWTFDGSRGQHRTRILFEKSLSVVVTLMRFSGFPPLKPARRLIRELLEAASFDASSPDG